jgi:DNA-binding NarL/FixJ family response regulator
VRKTKNRTILVVEDFILFRQSIVKYLNKSNLCYEIFEAEDLSMAQTILENKHPEIVVLDINLGNENGFDLLESTQIRNHESKVIIFSMHADTFVIQEAFERGASAYVSKDASFHELNTAIIAVSNGENFVNTQNFKGRSV